MVCCRSDFPKDEHHKDHHFYKRIRAAWSKEKVITKECHSFLSGTIWNEADEHPLCLTRKLTLKLI